jgi:heme-degrading monooxygenase HmoA
MTMRTGEYLIPAIKALPGPIGHYAATSPDGNVIHVSIWDSEEHAKQLSSLKEMVVIAREEAENAGCTFGSISHYPIDWAV